VMIALGHVYRGRMVDLRPTNAKLRSRAERTVRELADVSPAQAKLLLAAAGRPSVALAMHFTGLPRPRAELALEAAGLRVLERARRHR
jgi:N-acetylmuramic acid 6-phosphate etherase